MLDPVAGNSVNREGAAVPGTDQIIANRLFKSGPARLP